MISQPRRLSSPPPPESIIATVPLQGQDFAFKLFRRPLPLGQYGTIDYYWMSSAAFRSLKSDSSAANFHACIRHWWAAMRASGLGDDPEQQAHLVTAIVSGPFDRRAS
jgi:hypothetical protein